MREQTVAEQHGNLIAPVRRKRRLLPAQYRFIHHVVVRERGQMNHLDDDRDGDEAVVRLANGRGAQGHERRAQLLALIRQCVLGVRGDFRVESVNLLGQPFGHRFQKRLDRLHNLFPGMRWFGGGRGGCNRFGFDGQHPGHCKVGQKPSQTNSLRIAP